MIGSQCTIWPAGKGGDRELVYYLALRALVLYYCITLASWQLFFPEVLGTLQAHAESMPLMRKEAAI